MKYGSRKFILAMFTVLSANVLVVVGAITASVWGAAVGAVVATYMAGNVGQKAVEKPGVQ